MIIGFVGLIGSGKDTAADYLVNNRGFKRDSFAAPLKDAVANVFGWDRQLLEGATAESRHWREQTDLWWASRLGIPSIIAPVPARTGPIWAHLIDAIIHRVSPGTIIFLDHMPGRYRFDRLLIMGRVSPGPI